MLVWVDETGSGRRSSIRSYGYSLRGMRACNQQLRIAGKRINAIGIMSCAGVEDVYVTEENVDGDVFEDFVQTTLLPLLMPFNGVNSHSVVIMDNASIHHMEKITEMIEGVGALVRFLPPYSPDLNTVMSTLSSRTLVSVAFNGVCKADCIGYVRHAGYMY